MPYFRIKGQRVHLKLSGRAKATKPCVAMIEIDGKSCHCMGISTILCDWPVEGGTCNAPLCEQHAEQIGPDRHLCPIHYRQQSRRRNSSEDQP